MPKSIDVTVVICTRNGRSRGFLDEALASVLEQTAPPSEILLVDDGSSDGTADHVRLAYPEVRVLANAGTGLAAARNTGINAARNPWISFLDDDDLWCQEKLATQMAQATASTLPESTIWAAREAAIGEQGGPPTPVPMSEHFAGWPACLLGCPVSPSGAMISRVLLRRIGSFDESLDVGATYEFWIRCLASGATVGYSEKTLFLYRRHRAQISDSSHLVEMGRSLDAMILPYVKKLPAALAGRIELARKLTWFRCLVARCGIKAARRYWHSTPLQPGRQGLRPWLYFLLDSAASKAPQRAKRLLRKAALRFLLGASRHAGPPPVLANLHDSSEPLPKCSKKIGHR